MSKTIAAIATPQGKGGIGIVRISGDDAKKIADKLFHAHSEKSLCEVSGYTAHYGNIIKNGKTIDDAVALVFTAPKSYTGEDTVEISCHGGDYVVKQVLRLAIDCGAIPADRGEFTKMAFLNGKMDLAQAESVANIISAEGRQALISAVGARGGKISNEIAEIKASLLEAAARVAAFSDFPDEEPDFSGIDNLGCILNSVLLRLQNLLKNYDAGKILRNGINTVIIGKPNVGKSTLMNLLSGCERSIVTSVAGTTRDIVEETIKLGEIKLCLADTAGIRETNDEIEKIGVNRATERISSAQLIMAVFDSSVPLDDQDKKLIEFASGRPIIAVLNKSDLCTVSDTSFFETCGIATVPICAKNGEGADELRQCIENLVGLERLSEDALILSSERQRACAIKAFNELNNATEILAEGMTFDAIGVLIDEALSALMELTGERVTEEVANEVFSRFCVGK